MPKHKQSNLASLKTILGSETHRQVYTEIAYLKKRIHLVEGERKANYESNEEQLKQNEIIIHGIRQKNSELKKENKEVANLRDNYFQAILSRLKDSKQIPIFRGKNFEESVDILECKIGDLKNKLNLLHFDKKQVSRKKKMIVTTERAVKITLAAENPQQNKNVRMEKLKDLENSISTTQLRITEAENVRSRYKYMIETLESENFTKNLQILEMETKLLKQTKEKATTNAVLVEAIKARKAARAKLIEVEDTTMKDYGVREQKLFQCRGNLKDIREKMEQIGTKLNYPKFHMIHRDSSLAEGLYLGIPSESREIKSQTTMEKVYKQLQEMTGESDPASIIARFQQQREHAKELEVKEKEMKSELRKTKLRKRFLEDKLNNLQFCGGVQFQDLDKHHAIVCAEIQTFRKQNTEARTAIEEYSAIMEEAIVKLNEICNQNGLRLRSTVVSPTEPGISVSSERVIEILKLLITTLEHVLEEQEIFQGPMGAGARLSTASENELSDISGVSIGGLSTFKYGGSSAELNNLLTPGITSNLGDLSEGEGSFTLQEKKRGMVIKGGKTRDKKSDSSEDEEAISRILIKRKSQVLVESKTRKGRFNPGIPLSPRPK